MNKVDLFNKKIKSKTCESTRWNLPPDGAFFMLKIMVKKTLKELYPYMDDSDLKLLGEKVAEYGVKRICSKILEGEYMVNLYEFSSFKTINKIVGLSKPKRKRIVYNSIKY